MKLFDIFFSSLLTCITSLPLITVILTLQGSPVVPPNPTLDQAQINQIQQLLIDHDPRQLLASDYQEVRLTESELNALTTYVKNTNPTLKSVNIHTRLIENGASIALSIPFHALGFQPYYNITLNFTHMDDRLSLESLDVGALSIPSTLLTPLHQAVTSRLAQQDNFQLVSSFIDSLHFQSINEERVVIMLDWQGENLQQLEDQARQVFVSEREAQRLIFYHEKLSETLAAFPSELNSVALNDLLRPLFLYASINSSVGISAITENRAVFIVLSAYLTDLELAQLIGTEVELETPREIDVEIERREDLARHVVSSAAIAASAGATMAEMLSVYKEVHDSRYRTGFSFTDIAANLSGSFLGTLASRNEADASRFQELMKEIRDEAEFMPPLGTYDGMTEEEFISQYGSRESEAYQQRLAEITDSIAARPFYQNFGN